jgi:hypothetical protein
MQCDDRAGCDGVRCATDPAGAGAATAAASSQLASQLARRERRERRSAGRRAARTTRRLFNALLLHALLLETPVHTVAQRYGVSRGQLQQLQAASSQACGAVVLFCRSLRWDALATLLATFAERLEHGVQPELLDLMRCSDLQPHRARALYRQGCCSVLALARLGEAGVVRVLCDDLPFEGGDDGADGGGGGSGKGGGGSGLRNLRRHMRELGRRIYRDAARIVHADVQRQLHGLREGPRC